MFLYIEKKASPQDQSLEITSHACKIQLSADDPCHRCQKLRKIKKLKPKDYFNQKEPVYALEITQITKKWHQL